ncbi:hypothetical protein KAZ66_01930 [Candidatus Woesebacteria bacterium]|nr:hypothetical protein [Candidatus Woesebacteria bacterium]
MLSLILILLVILFILGYLQIPAFTLTDMTLFIFLGRAISLYDILIFGLILWIIQAFPWPFRGLASLILVLWLLSFFGIIAIPGFSNLLIFTLIVGIIAYIFRGVRFRN